MNRMSANLTAFVLTGAVTFDAIAWSGLTTDVPHDKHFGCIHPPPFGRQCTLHAGDSLRACLSAPGCRAITCPSPDPYTKPLRPRHDGITGAICQLRSVRQGEFDAGKSKASNHGMCREGRTVGCKNVFLKPAVVQGHGSNVAAIAVRLSQLVDSRGRGDTLASWRTAVVDRHIVPARHAFPLVLLPTRGLFADVPTFLGLTEEIGVLPSSSVTSAEGEASLGDTGPFRVFAVPLSAPALTRRTLRRAT